MAKPLLWSTKITKSKGQKEDKDTAQIIDKPREYKLSISVGPAGDLEQLEKLEQTIIQAIVKSGGQQTLLDQPEEE